MKKIYITPQTAIHCVELQQMIAASDLLKETSSGLEQDFTTPVTTSEISGNLSRGSFWDDEEE